MLHLFGAWLSLVEHRHGVAGVVGSNPTVPTKFLNHLRVINNV